MREAGYRVVDQVVEYLESLPSLPALNLATGEQLDTPAFGISDEPRDIQDVLHQGSTRFSGTFGRYTHDSSPLCPLRETT